MKTLFRLIPVLCLLLAPAAPAEQFNMPTPIAYPNPFNPETDLLTIKPADASVFSGSVEYTIYNYNQLMVHSGSTSNSVINWSGHRADGSRVPPGLYFVRIVHIKPDLSTGTTFVKILIK